MKNLTAQDADLYYKLFLSLLDYVNKKNRMIEGLKMEGAKELDPEDVHEVSQKLWSEVSMIDEYLARRDSKNLTEEERAIVESWKKCISGTFIMERHLKDGSIFIHMESERVFQVCGIRVPWEEVFDGFPLPIFVKLTILPFRDKLIFDSIALPYNIIIGGNMKKDFKDIYMRAKQCGQIIKSL